MVIKNDIKKRIVCIILVCFVALGSFFGSYAKSYAAAPVAMGLGFAGLLALCGVSISHQTTQEINMTGTTLLDNFITWDAKQPRSVGEAAIMSFVRDATTTGRANLHGNDVWLMIKAWVVFAFYQSGLISGKPADDRPNITDTWFTKSQTSIDRLTEMSTYFYDTSTYPYYFEINKTNLGYKGYDKTHSVIMCFTGVPLLWYENGDLNLMYMDYGSAEYPFEAKYMTGYITSTGGADYSTVKDYKHGDSMTIKLTTETINLVNSNVPLFDSREAALGWWNDNVIDGVLNQDSIDVPLVKVPDGVCDDIYERDNSLDNYDVVGADTYVDENGKLQLKDVAIPTAGVLLGLATGALTWQDVLSGNYALDKVGTADIGLATDLTTGKTLTNAVKTSQHLKMFKADLKTVFPFCIPFDLIDAVKMFKAEPKAPRFEWKMSFKPLVNYTHTFVIDLSGFESLAIICRTLFTIIFCVGLGFVTRNLIRG